MQGGRTKGRNTVAGLEREEAGALWCEGRRAVELPPGSRVENSRQPAPVRFARLHQAPFTDRLVAKFALPVDGWRGRRDGHDHHDDHHEHGVAHVHPSHGAPG